ncbi:tRNA (adenosine(37)-N6)-dimethylallyltransferase MiaA [Arachnia propionica]|uniref:tRNA dimethylallyltransferase n=1 Tax=Arachnia propionica TaxID=1750 RepID=A0A3P1WS10_9ACTN|nr:tRNA (adenosine(37)-N6)-dimethylallyltransferase MiaA [Arachnia propionica]RRD49085.1 tRNA (adenosine(37)-N6)-dimethylallyltransferase MiaA [Arachnia propionica]
MQPPMIVLVGPTATGKSALAIECCHRMARDGGVGEIVNGDSMLVYRGMDIGTAKPAPEERGGIVHHLVDVMDVTETASVAWFQRRAREVIEGIRARGAVPVLVGGSALYTRAITDHFDFPGSDPELRARLEGELERLGAAALHRRLSEVAPASAAWIEPGNGRRIVRALEVHELTGGHQAVLPEWTYELDGVHQFGLTLERTELDRRIDARVDAMFEAGLVAEVHSLLDRGLAEGRTASMAIGYRQVIEHLHGLRTEAEARDEVKRATRRFFRKQLGWYRRDPRITWLTAGDPDNVERILRAVGL